MLITLVGLVIIGAAVTVGVLAAKSGDIAGKWAANKAFNFGDWLNSL